MSLIGDKLKTKNSTLGKKLNPNKTYSEQTLRVINSMAKEKTNNSSTTQQKMDNLWEEEKQTTSSNTTSIQKGKTGLPWTMEARMNNVMSKPISEESIKHIKETSPILNPEKYHKETDAGYYGGRAVEGLFGATEGVLDALAIAGKHIMAPQMKKAEEITSFNGVLPNPISKGFGNLEETYRVTLPEKAMQENPTQIFSDSLNFKYNNTNKAERLVGDVISGATSMVPTIGANLAVPGLGYAVLGAQGFGGGTQQAYQKTGELGAEEELYGLLSGLAEVGVEKISGGIGGLGNGAVDKIASKMIKNGFIRNATGEGIEEAVTTFIDPYLQRLTYDKEATGGITDIETWKEALRNALIGTLTSMVLQAPSSISDTTKQIKSNINSNVDTKKLNDIDSITQSQLAEINNNISQGETIDIKNKNTEEVKSKLEKLVPTQKNDALQSVQNEPNNTANQITPTEGKTAQNGNMEQTTQGDKVMDVLLGKKAEKAQNPVQIKAEETLTSAKQAGMTDIDINKATELNNLLQSNAKLQFYDENNLPQGFSEEDSKKAKIANGFYSNGTIYINKNSKNVVEKILGHELTHHLETTGSFNDLSNTILDSDVFYDYMTEKGFKNVQAFKQSLLENGYAEQQLDNEIVARFVEDNLFSNQDRINRLARNNTTLAEKIKNFISDLKVKLKGTAQEKQLLKIEDMYRKALEQARSTENTTSDTKYHISSNLSNDIDNVLVNLNERNPVKLRDYTPNILVQNGIKDLPMYENPSHIRKNILSENEARNIGLQVARNDHYHGLGKELYIKVIDSLDDPRAVLKYKNKSNEYIILTVVKDSQGNNIIVPVEVETDTYVNNVKIDINRIKSVYGYDRTNPDLNKYIKDSIKNNNLEKIYEKKKPSTGKTPQSVSNNSINQNDSSVNTQYSLDKQNDTAGKESAFSMPETDNQGRKLSKEQQEYFKDSKVRDEQGNLKTVYHGTEANVGVPEEYWFTIFDIDKSGRHGNLLGDGFYFTDNKEHAEKYSHDKGNVYETYLNIKNPLELENNEEGMKILKRFKEKADKELLYLRNYLKHQGYDGIHMGEVYVAFDSSQIKNVDNINPTENPDIRFSVNPIEIDEQLKEKVDEYSGIKKGEKATRDVELPKQISDKKYVSQFARTMAEAGITPNEEVDQIKQMVLDGTLTHERITDKGALRYANKVIEEDGFKNAVDMWNSAMKSDLTMDKKMIALGQQIYNQAVQNKDVTLVKQMIADLTYISTVAGQNVQASRMFKKLTPDGKLYSLEKSLKKINEDLLEKYEDKFKEIEIPEDLAKKLLEAEDTASADKIVEEIEEHIAKNIPASLMDKLNAWRYLAMLGNPKTHIRNIIGNAAFVPVVEWKNVIGTGLEQFIPQGQRTKAVINHFNEADKKLLDFAEYDFDANKKHIKGEDKFNIATNIDNKRKIFDNKLLESARKFNSDMLEFEDELFFKRAYRSSLAQAMKAQGITVDYARENSNESNKKMNELRDYAILEAQKATYRDFNTVANWLSNAQRKAKTGYNNATDIKGKVGYKVLEVGLEGLIPFKKTPTNILSRGVSYSPLGLMRGISNAVLNVKKGNVTATQAIDQISQGLSGTSILALGILLAKYGILSGADKEDEKEAKFDKLKGSQNYALNIGDTSYTIDWLAPTSMPLFVGVELYKSLSGESDDDILTTMAKISEPAFEMSMLQGISSTMNTTKYSKTNPIASIAGNLGLNYINQYNPTLFGQLARTLEDTSRTTYVDKNSSQPAWLQKMIQKNVAKIPVANKTLVPVIDQWGRTKQEESIVSRAVQNFISPGYVSKKNVTDVDKEIERLYKQVGEKDILPSYAPKYWNVDGERVDLTAKQYEKFAVEKGQDALNLIDKLIKSDAYKKLDDKEKYNAIKYVYDYANQTNKTEITPQYPVDDWIKDAQELEKQGIDVDTFIGLKTAVKDIKGDKDAKGNTKPYSASNKKKEIVDELIPGYSKKQKNLIYDALGISTKK